MTSEQPGSRPRSRPARLASTFGSWFDRGEGWFASAILATIALLLTAQFVLRGFGHPGIPAALPVVQHLTLWLAFVGAALAASEGRMLALATGQLLPEGKWRTGAQVFATTAAACVTALLAVAGWRFLLSEKEFGEEFALGIPTWVALLVLPVSLGLIALRLVWKCGDRRSEDGSGTWLARGVAALGLVAAAWVASDPEWWIDQPAWPVLLVLALAMVFGAPIYSVLGGAAIFLFLIDWVPMEAVPVETYRLAVSPTLPAIPLFTLTGFLLAEGKSSDRLVGVFRSVFGWIPGGTAVVAAVVCAFFTVFTGGSGVTILALGGLLYQALDGEGYRERFNLGLLTASGSLGLLLPPALPLILYGIVAEVPIRDLFLGGLLPGLLLVALIAAWGVREGLVSRARTTAFDGGAALRALWLAKWELVLPAVLVGAILGGFATPVEASALSVTYALFVQCFIHRDLHVLRDLPRRLPALRGAHRRRPDHPLRRHGPDELSGGRPDPHAAARLGAEPGVVEAGLPAAAQRLPARRRMPDGHLLGHRRGGAADRAAGPRLRHPPGAPGHHLHRQPGAGLSDAARGIEPLPGVVSLREAADDDLSVGVPMLVILAIGVVLITYVPWLTTITLDWFGG